MHKIDHSASETLSGETTLDYHLEQSFAVQSKSLLCVVYDELVLTHMNTRASEWETHIIGETHIRVRGNRYHC